MFKKVLPIIALIPGLMACTSPGYQCPLHDQTQSCLSELQAYKAPLPTKRRLAVRSLPYVVERVKPDTHILKQERFRWYGNIN